MRKIRSALISTYDKNGLLSILKLLDQYNVTVYSTSGTKEFIQQQDIKVISIESLTNYPSILGGRVKTLHPKVFGGILARRDYAEDRATLNTYNIPVFDLVIINLYPFEKILSSKGTEQEIIENIDIGGVALIRSAAKNFNYTTIIASREQYLFFENSFQIQKGIIPLEDRRFLAAHAFHVASHYDTAIFHYFNQTLSEKNTLRLL